MTDYNKCDPYLVNVRYRHRYFDVGIIRPRPNWPKGAFTYDVRFLGRWVKVKHHLILLHRLT